MKKENIFLISTTLVVIFISCFLYITRMYQYDNIMTISGTLLLLIVTMSNDLYRISTKFGRFVRNLHIFGITSFLLIVPHTGETGDITRKIATNQLDYTVLYLAIPFIAFFVLLIMTLTSIQGFQPRWWKKFHKIIWITCPFISLHLWMVDYKIMGVLFIVVMLLPIVCFFIDEKHKKMYIKQIYMLILGVFLMYITITYTSFVSSLLNLSLVLVPMLLLLAIIIFIKDKKLKKVFLKYFVFLVIIILMIIMFRGGE